MSRIDDAIGHLGAILVQTIPSDDKIIIDHVRDAHRLLTEHRSAVFGPVDPDKPPPHAELLALLDHWETMRVPSALAPGALRQVTRLKCPSCSTVTVDPPFCTATPCQCGMTWSISSNGVSLWKTPVKLELARGAN